MITYIFYTQNNPLHKQRGVLDQSWRTWVIWDVINIAWLINPNWVPTKIINSSSLDNELYWIKNDSNHLIREAFGVNRDEIFNDFFKKLNNLK